MRLLLIWTCSALLLSLPKCAVSDQPNSPLFEVQFKNSIESIGVGLVPTANLQSRIPDGFVVVGANDPVTPIVVRTARCNVTALGFSQKNCKIVQIGAVIVPPDGTGDINNYCLFYYTDHLFLALALNLSGVRAQYVPGMQYTVNVDGHLSVRVPFPASSRMALVGEVVPSNAPAGAFVANWWQSGYLGAIKMSTSVPSIQLGTANLDLTTPEHSELAAVLGSSEFGFPILQQFNGFDSATMTVSINE